MIPSKIVGTTIHRQARTAVLLSTCLAAFLFLGCGTQNLREAQNHFSTAARAENAKTLGDPTASQLGDLMLADAQAINEYRLACAEATQAVAINASPRTDQERLERGTGRMIQLYSRWRLAALSDKAADSGQGVSGACVDGGIGGVSQLAATIDQEKAAGTIQLGQRERVMLNAIPGLLEHELAQDETTDWGRARGHLCEAVTALDRAASDADEDHPVRAYLYLAQLRSIDVWVEKTSVGSPGDDVFGLRSAEVRPLIGLPVCGIEAWRKTIGDKSEQARLTKATAIELTRRAGFNYAVQARRCAEPRPVLPVCTCSPSIPACHAAGTPPQPLRIQETI